MATQDVLLKSTRSLERKGNNISLIMVEFLNNVKAQPLGFRELGLDFLSISQIVSALKSSLEEHFETNQPFPERAVPELNRIVTKTGDDFENLERLLKKFMDFEKGGAVAKLQKTWRMLFADKDIAKVHHSLQENKGALNMAMLLTNINAQGTGAYSYEYGLLAARLQQTSQESLPNTMQPQSPASFISELDGSSSYAPSTSPPTISSGDTDKIAIPAVSGLTIDDGLIPVEHPPAPPPRGYSPVSAMSSPAPPPHAQYSPVSAIVSPDYTRQAPEPPNDSQQAPESSERNIVPAPSSIPIATPQKLVKVAVRVDRAAIQKRVPTSTAGANSAPLKNTLISAVEGAKHKIVEQLLNRGVPPDTGPEKNAVHIAVNRQDVDTLKLLLEFGADPDSLDSRERTAISYACFLKDDLTKLLLDFGADPNLCAPNWLPLAWAIDTNKLNQVQTLLQYGADPDGVSKNGETCLYYAAARPRAIIVQEILDWGADANKKNSSGDTPLIGASQARQADNIKILLAHGALPNVSGPRWAALPWILDSGDAELVRYFLEHGGEVNGFSENEEHHMVYAGSHAVECMRVLIEHGGDVNAKNKRGNTPLVAACSARKFDVAKLLLTSGADPNLSSDNWAALPWVIDSGDDEMVNFMLDHGADPYGKSKNGWINMFYAVDKPHEKVVKAMLMRGGDVNLKDGLGQTLLEYACRCGRLEIVKLLLENGANPNVKGQQYPVYHCMKQPECLKLLLGAGADLKLHPGLVEFATFNNGIETIKILLEHGVDVDEPHQSAFRALSTSIRDNHPEIFDFLLKAGANPNLKGPALPVEGALAKPPFLKPLIVAGADITLLPGILELAVFHNQIESVQILLDVAKVDINELRPSGHGAVTTAIRDNRVEILAELIARKADLNVETIDGLPVIMACRSQDDKKLRMLLDAGVDVNKTDRHRGQSALMQACAEGRKDSVQLLLKHGADVNKTGRNGESPIDIAAKHGHEEIVMFLLEGIE